MATGIHWEWRGFGPLRKSLRKMLEALPALYPAPAVFRDRYLWIPGCDINVKLRQGLESGLKFKRFLDRQGRLELWEERADELYPFPLEPATFRALVHTLGLDQVALPDRPIVTEDALLRRLKDSRPRVHVIEVRKRRTAHLLEVPVPGGTAAVIVEAAEISAPQYIWSVALEDATGLRADSSQKQIGQARTALAAAHDRLGLPDGLHAMNYLQALAVWARGAAIPAGP